MLKFKVKYNHDTGYAKTKSSGKNTGTMEHLIMIVEIMKSITNNTDEYTKEEILEMVSSLYDANIEGDE